MALILRNPQVLTNPRLLLTGGSLLVAVVAAASLRFLAEQPLAALTGGSLTGAAQSIALEADDVQVVGRSGGKPEWRLAAQSVTLSRDRRALLVSGIHRGALYGPQGRAAVLLTADRASYTTPFGVLGAGGAGALQVQGHVKAQVQSASHLSLQTEQIVWDSVSNSLSCPVSVSAQVPKLHVTAGSARYDSPPGKPAEGVMRLIGGVRADFSSTRGLAALSCPGLTWNANTQAAQTLGAVTAAIPGGLGKATADSITVSTRTGDLTGRGIRGTLRVSGEVQ